ncbi:MAG: hypothetical protein L0Y32_00810 [Nevskiales bacterium]|nr:hypothetical protein [Nevskiales bacterium]
MTVEKATWTDPARGGRPVKVMIYAPALSEGMGPFPLIPFSHGFGETYETYAQHGKRWAASGYITIVVNHQGTDRDAMKSKRPSTDFSLRPADIRFVIDQALSPAQDNPLLKGRVDASRIGMSGHSLGSSTSLAMIGLQSAPDPKTGKRESWADPRVKAAIVMSPQIGGAAGGGATPLEKFLDIHSWDNVQKPVLFWIGSRDAGNGKLRDNPMLRQLAYDHAPSPDKHEINIINAQHHAWSDTPPWYGGDPRDPHHYDWIDQADLAFLDAYVKEIPEARAWLNCKVLEQTTTPSGHRLGDASAEYGVIQRNVAPKEELAKTCPSIRTPKGK